MPRTSHPYASWSLQDLIDFEYLLCEESEDPSAPRSPESDRKFYERWRRDRTIFEALLEANAPEALEPDRRALFRSWLGVRGRRGTYLPGEDLTSAWRTLVSILVAAAFVFGLAHAGTLLVLEQDSHVSATRFFMLTAGLQVFLTLCGLVFYSLRRSLRRHFGTFESLRLTLVTALLRWRRLGFVNAKLRRAIALLAARRRLYRGLAFGHVVLATQLCFIAMSLGIVVSLIAYHFAYRDVRFGWSTTHAFSAEEISRAVDVISAPWAWLLPPARPTLAQVAESHLTEDDRGRRVSAQASRAWANFLVAGLAFYGVALRLAFAALAYASVRRQLGATKLSHPDADQLWNRLTTPLPPDIPTEPDEPDESTPRLKPPWWWPFPWPARRRNKPSLTSCRAV